MAGDRFDFLTHLVNAYENGWRHDPGFMEDAIFHEIMNDTLLDTYDFLEESREKGIEISLEELTEWAWMKASRTPKGG